MSKPGLEKFRHNSKGFRAVMRSGAMEAELQARANKVKAAAAAGLSDDGDDVELIADTQVGKNRAGATVIGVPMRIEAARRVLGRAIDAAR